MTFERNELKDWVRRPAVERNASAPMRGGLNAKRAGAFLKSKFGGLVRRYATRNERLRVCETLPLGGRRSLVLVECDGQSFLAGLSADGVQTLVRVQGNPRGEQA